MEIEFISFQHEDYCSPASYTNRQGKLICGCEWRLLRNIRIKGENYPFIARVELDGHRISTVWSGAIEHPFETLATHSDGYEYQANYMTEVEARAGHRSFINSIMSGERK